MNSLTSGRYICEIINTQTDAKATDYVYVKINEECEDNKFFSNCREVVKQKYCHNKYYAGFCCKSCTLAGLL